MRKLSTLLEGISYRRLESIIGLSYKVLIRYDKGEAVSEQNLRIITDFINKCETEPEYKADLLDFEKAVRVPKIAKIQLHGTMMEPVNKEVGFVKTVVNTETPIGYFVPQEEPFVDAFGFPTKEEKSMKIPNTSLYGTNPVHTQQLDAVTAIANTLLDQLHTIIENQKQLWEHMKELVEIQPVNELIAISNKIEAIENVLESTNSHLSFEPVLKTIKETALGKNSEKPFSVSAIKSEDAYPTSLPSVPPETIKPITTLLTESQSLPSTTFLDDDILNILPL